MTRWWAVLFGLAVALVAMTWLWVECGCPPDVAGARSHLDASFDRFGAALPLTLVVAGAAIWMVVVPVGLAMRRDGGVAGWYAIAGCAVPLAGFILAAGIVGGLVARGAGDLGWSVWQDTVAQFCLPAGAVAALVGGLAAAMVKDGLRQACWTSASSGGLVLMAIGRADDGGLGAAFLLATAQWLVLCAWVLVAGRGVAAPAWRAWVAFACAASLAGIWPLPGGLARWRLAREMLGGGFGGAWDGALLVAVVLSWLLALVAWCGWLRRTARGQRFRL